MFKYWLFFLWEFKYVPNVIFSIDNALHEIHICLLSVVRVDIVVLWHVFLVVDDVHPIVVEDIGEGFHHDEVQLSIVEFFISKAFTSIQVASQKINLEVIEIFWAKITLNL